MSELSPESANSSARPISPEYVVALAKKASLYHNNERIDEPEYPADLSDIAKVYLLDLEETFRGIKEEIRLTGKSDGYVVTDILMLINDSLIAPKEYKYLIHYAWYMCILNNINQHETPAPRHIKQARHRHNIVDEIRHQQPQVY